MVTECQVLTPKPILSAYGNTDADTPTSTPIMVRVFGKLEITGPGMPSPTWRTAKVRELFALFLQHRPEGIYRETLLGLLWEDISKEKALANLNTCNYYLRKFLEKSETGIMLVYENGYYSLDLGEAQCDCDLFEKAEKESANISAANLDSILYGASLYRGKYYEDVKCSWANLMRVQYDTRYANLRAGLAQFYESAHQIEDSISQLIMAIDTNPLCERAWLLLLKNYAAEHDSLHYNKTLSNRNMAYRKYTGKDAPEIE